MKDLLFIGSAVADVVVHLPHIPRENGDDVHITSQSVSLGGCACNAFLAAQLIRPEGCSLLAPVGSGVWGDFVASALAQRGVRSLAPSPAEPNGCCYCLVDASGERTFLSHHGAEYVIRPEWVADAAPEGKLVYLCGLEVEEASGPMLIGALEEHRPDTLFFAPGPRICRIAPEKMARLLAMHPVMHLNAAEAVQFTRCEDIPQAADMIRSLTDAAVIVTLGADGAYVSDAADSGFVPGFPAQVSNTIGAGDSHIGACVALYSLGHSLREAAWLAGRMSAAVVSVPGGALTREEYDRLVRPALS